jgi:hypothetical protein
MECEVPRTTGRGQACSRFLFPPAANSPNGRDCFRFFEATAVSACGACLLGSGPVGLPLDSQTSLERGGCGSSVKTLGEDASTFFTPDQQFLSGFKVAWMRLEVNHCTFWTPRAAAGGGRTATEDAKGVKFAGQTDTQTSGFCFRAQNPPKTCKP